MSGIEDKLRVLGLALPPPKPPVAAYLGAKRSGDLLFVSGRVSEARGEVGTDISADAARRAARDTMLLLLSIVREEVGNLEGVRSASLSADGRRIVGFKGGRDQPARLWTLADPARGR